MKLVKKLSIFLVLLSFFSSSFAATIVCGGKVSQLSYHANNKLMIRLDSMNAPVFFCSPDGEWSVSGTGYVTGAESCKTMYSSFLSAMMSGKTIHSLYFDGDSVPATCDGWGSWSSANIRYFSLLD